MIEWDEPMSHDPVTNLHCSVTREDAIKFQRQSAAAHKSFYYETDEQALEDFMVIRWAKDTGEST